MGHNAAFFLGLSFLVISCAKSGSSNQISFDSRDTGILNGKRVTSSDIAAKSVVRVIAKGTSQEPKKEAQCTGTLVEKRFVVTAAHCLIADNGSRYKSVSVSFPYAGWTEPKKIPSKAFLTHPLFRQVDQWSYDVGLILLESEAPAESRPANIPLSYVDLKSVTLYEAGYGSTELDNNPLDDLHWAPVSLLSETEINLMKTKSNNRLLEVNSKEARTFVINQSLANATGFCQGDSGGPLFYLQGSVMILLGVNSSTPQTGCFGTADVYSVPYLRRFFAEAFYQLRTLGKLEGKAHIPAWENRNSLSSDSQNIEIWRAPKKFPLELNLVNESYSFKKARLVSQKSADQKMYNDDDFELQLSTDEKFNCTSKSMTWLSSPTIAIPLFPWPKTKMIESEGYFLVFKDNQYHRETVRAQIFEINEGHAKFNIMNANNLLVSIETDILDCRDQ